MQEETVKTRKWWSGLRKCRSETGSGGQDSGSGDQEQEVAIREKVAIVSNRKWRSGTGSGGQDSGSGGQDSESAVRNRKWWSGCRKQEVVVRNRKVLGVLTESVEMDQSQRRRRVIGPCAVGRWCQAGRL